jgi:mono/diheme cytochrome c family protein
MALRRHRRQLRGGWLAGVLRLFVAIAAIGVIVAGGLDLWLSQPEIAAVDPPAASIFDPLLVAKGGQLAALGNCVTCHTDASGKPFAGGRALPTPFGTVYSTNITPHPDSGIGHWSEAAFRRALRDGVGRTGEHLYPAFPYDHFTRMNDEDVSALYAYLMTRPAVAANAPPNRLPFPLNFRLSAAIWKVMFLDKTPAVADRPKADPSNRGAYLVDAVAHCGACHTPRNFLGAE